MEFFDVYDDNRVLTGKVLEKGTRLEEGENRMVVHLCIFNSKGEMLIQQRQSFKKGWPNMWDITLGGCSQAGETSRDTVKRELSEELGVEYDFSKNKPYLTINFENGFDDIYFLEMDLDVDSLTLQYEEVQGAKWATKDEILNLRKEGKFIPYHESFLAALFEMRTKRGLY